MLKKAWAYITRSWEDVPYHMPLRFSWLPPIFFEALGWLAILSIIIRLSIWLLF